MNIKSANFIKGIVGPDRALEDHYPQFAFIGRSNVGKSSVINSLTGQKGLAKTSSFPGRTQQINLFLINNSFYLIDLPGYGFAKASKATQEKIQALIYWYLFESPYAQKKIFLIIDANIGPTDLDLEMIEELEQANKNIVIIANKIDKIKKPALTKQLQKIQTAVGGHVVIPYSADKNIGISKVVNELLYQYK